MKRITSIQIENYRAFYGKNYKIQLVNGQNLLIYGENGSGKSSFFKALSNFFSSSRGTNFPYIRNHHQMTDDGEIVLTFNDYDPVAQKIISKIGEAITFGSEITSTVDVSYVNASERIKGFLDYRSLLDVYNHKTAQPNLFELIVTDLLLNYIPPGGVYELGTKWKELNDNLVKVNNRNERKHRRALLELPSFELALRTSLDQIMLRLNYLLIKYFKLNLRVRYDLSSMLPYDYVEWKLNSSLRLILKLDGVIIHNQSDYLNEARLSALSICLYLSALIGNTHGTDYKILFLDDVFIGLDAGNRLPILSILKNEFSDYQIFISTYDRHWFELAKRFYDAEEPSKWITAEFYVGKEKIKKIEFQKPIVIQGETDYDKAVKYLHDRSRPDYPAAANYFRKAIEKLIEDFIPWWELTGDENIKIPNYKLSPLINRAKHFFDKTGINSGTINKIIPLIPAILHPLSHHEISSPIYKGELSIIEYYIPLLEQELLSLNISDNYQCSNLNGNDKIVIKYVIDQGTKHFSFYELKTTEPICLKRNPGGQPIMSKVNCVVTKCIFR